MFYLLVCKCTACVASVQNDRPRKLDPPGTEVIDNIKLPYKC